MKWMGYQLGDWQTVALEPREGNYHCYMEIPDQSGFGHFSLICYHNQSAFPSLSLLDRAPTTNKWFPEFNVWLNNYGLLTNELYQLWDQLHPSFSGCEL